MLVNDKMSMEKSQSSDKEIGEKHILILLTKYPDFTSRLLQIVNGWSFTHVSIGIEDSTGQYFSFVGKGFRIENPQYHPTAKKKEVPCELYRIPVSEKIYDQAKQLLAFHVNNAERYRYSYLGLFFCIMHIPFKTTYRYFCSQFVAEVLECAKVIELGKHSSLYTPDDFSQIHGVPLVYRGTLRELINHRNRGISPAHA